MADAADGDALWKAQTIAQAVELEAMAAHALKAPGPLARGAGHEVALRDDPDAPGRQRELARASRIAPDMLDAEASLDRLGLARDVGVLTLAVEAAQAAGATSPAEQMLAHQMATAHTMAMRLASRADAFLSRRFSGYQSSLPAADVERQREQVASIEAARLTAASARMMDATARAALALDRLKNGARQTIIVQQTVVQEGGQAVVAGAMDSRERKGTKRNGK